MTRTNRRTVPREVLAAVSFLASLFLAIGPGATRAEAQTHAYVANTTANVVTVLDTATNAVRGTIAVGTAPAEVVVTRDAARAYVTNTGSNSVSVIDTVTQTVVATFPVGDRPSGIAVAPGGDRVYVLGASGVVEVIDAGSHAVVASVAVGGTDGTVAIAPDGSRLYVASGNVSVIDTATNTLIGSFAPEAVALPDVDNFAVAVAISPDGSRAYVSVVTYYYDFQGFRAGGGIAVIDTATNAVTQTIPLYSLPGSLAFTRDGSRAYVGIEGYWADTGYGAAFFPGRWVAAIDAVTNATIAWIDLGADGALWNLQHTPAGLAVTPDRTGVYVSIPVINSVAAIDTATNVVKQTIAVAAGPSGVAVLPDPSATSSPYVIDAVNDSPALPLVASSAEPAVADVLANDTIGGARAAVGNVDLSTVSSTSAGVTLDPASGAVWIASDAELGSHSLIYEICEVGNPDNCDQAMVTLTVRAPKVIDAADDRATSFPGRTAIANVVANDTLDGSSAMANVALSLVSGGNTGVSLDLANGSVFVAAGTPVGDHALVYRICEIASPTNCDDGTVTVAVVPYVIRAENDSATAPRTGGTAVANVLANDTLDGKTATLARVTVSQVSSTAAGITLDAATASVSVARGTPAGVQILVYRICEAASPANCSDATVAVTVNPYVVNAVADQARASSKSAGTAIASVLANDRLGDAQATTANVRLALVSMTPATSKIRLDLSDGSVDVLGKTSSGLYTLVYEICETESLTNCGRATVSLELSGRN
jgi:YVTN family beta-propeller protein